MNFTCIPASSLSSDHVAVWDRIQRENPALDSPFLRPEFTLAVASVRNDIEVALIEDGGEVIGFLPFQRTRWNAGKPVGWKLCDVQGLVVVENVACDTARMVRACRLSAWDFHSVPAEQQGLQTWHLGLDEHASMDLSQGFDVYCEELRLQGSHKLKNVRRNWRRAEREVGPVRFEAQTSDPEAWASLLRWKSDQYRRTGAVDVFAFGWTIELLERIRAQQSGAFGGMLSSLYIGDQLAAVEFGLRSFGVDHSWFPAYNPALARYSAGNLLIVALAEASANLGIRRIDLGRIYNMEYKTSLMTDVRAMARGSVACRPLSRWLRQGWHYTSSWLKSSSLRVPMQLTGRWTRPLRGWLAYR